jgi:hypothetical protein
MITNAPVVPPSPRLLPARSWLGTAAAFLNSADSGSLMVEDVPTNPRAIGLLYAGSSTDAIANPINQVLSFLGATVVGE